MKAILSTKGQIVLPRDLRHRKQLHPGDELDLQETADGILIRKIRRNRGLVDHLQACPVADFKVPKLAGHIDPAKF